MSLTPEQLEIRKNLITCSQLPAIFGKSEYAAPIDVYTEKVFGAQQEPDEGRKRAMKAGSRHENAILLEFAEQMDCMLAIPRNGFYESPSMFTYVKEHAPATFIYPEKIAHPLTGEMVNWLGGTPDALIEKDNSYIQELFGLDRSTVGAVVQAKCVSNRNAHQWGESQFGSPPESVILQVWGEIILARAELKTDIDFGFVVALIGEPTMADYRFYVIRIDRNIEEALLDMARNFWHIVQRRDVAALDPEQGNWRPYFVKEFPRETTEKFYDPDGSLAMLWRLLADVHAAESKIKIQRKGLETTVISKCPSAGLFVCDDTELGKHGTLFTYKKSADGVTIDDEAVATQAWKAGANALAAIKPLITPKKREAYDKIIAAFPTLKALREANSTPKIGSRRFYIKGVPNGKANSDE